MSVTNNYSIANANVSSPFTARNGKIASSSLRSVTRVVTVNDLPVGAVVTSIVYNVTVSTTTADTLTIKGEGVGTSVTRSITARNSVLNFDDLMTGNAALTFTLSFKAKTGINTSVADGQTGSSTISFTNMSLSVTYESEAPTPPPEPDAEDIPPMEPVAGKHIIVYAPEETDFTTLGLAVLRPLECTITQVAGGEYSLRLIQPITTDGLWRFLTDGAIIKAPIPTESIPYVEDGKIADAVLYINESTATRYSNTGGSKRVTYNAWRRNVVYPVGARVTYNDQNYECIVEHWSLAFDSSKWRTISNYVATPATAVAEDPPGTIVVAQSVSNGWIKGKIKTTGTSGYWRLADFTKIEEEHEGIDAHDVVEQCFRIQTILRDSEQKRVEVDAVQLTYDWASSSLVSASTPTTLATALDDIMEKASPIMKYDAENDGKPQVYYQTELEQDIAADYGFQTVTYCILDPDNGLVKLTKARLVRDKWAFFLLVDETVNRGFRIEYGVNMRGVKWTRDTTNLVTRIYPRGKSSNGNVLLYTGPSGYEEQGMHYISSTRINEYPIIYCEALETGVQAGKDGVGNTDAAACLAMRKVALKRYSEQMCDCVEETIEVDFVMLGDSEEYKQYRQLQRVSLYDMVTVVHVPLGLTATAQVISYEWDAIRKRYNKITLGNPWTYGLSTVTGYDIGDGVIRYSKLSPEAIRKLKE